MTDLTLSIPSDASVVPNVFVLDRRDPELGTIVKYPDGRRRFDRIRIFVPQNFRCWRTLRLAVQYYRVAHVHIDHLLRRYAEFRWRYRNKRHRKFEFLQTSNESLEEKIS